MEIHQYASPNHSSRNGTAITILVMHATVGSFDSALGHMCNPAPTDPVTRKPNPDLAVSTHYEIGEDGFTAQLVDEAEAAWHAGVSSWRGMTKINLRSIGIELANRNDGRDPYDPPQYQAAVTLARDIVRRHDITPDNVVTHAQIAPSRKTDPFAFDMARFKADVFADAPAAIVNAVPVTVYEVVGDVVNVRSSTKVTGSTVTHQFHQGEWVWIGSVDHGERVTLNGVSSDQWAHMADTGAQPDLGWIWFPLLRMPTQVSVPNWIPDDCPIIGSPSFGRAVLDRNLTQHCPQMKQTDRDAIADAIVSCSKRANIGDVELLAQWAKECAWGTARRWIENFNPAGLGATNDGAEGAKFPTALAGFEAMVGHLLNYAAQPRDLNEQQLQLAAKDPRRAALQAVGNIGKAPRWIDLSQKWGVLPKSVPVPSILDPQAYGMSIIVRARSLV